MIISPLENSSLFMDKQWLQKRPIITQGFGERPEVYKQFGMDGHNGIDFRAKKGTPVYASHDGFVKFKDSGSTGYGKHIRIRDPQGLRETVYAHLSAEAVFTGEFVHAGDFIGYSGNTGFSTAAHLHWGYRTLKKGRGDVFNWKVENYDNGYYGWWDVSDYVITYKGTINSTSIHNL